MPSSGLILTQAKPEIYLDSIASGMLGQPTPVCPGLRKGTKGTDVWWHVDPKLLIPLSDQWKIAGASRQSRSGPENVHDAAEKEYYVRPRVQRRLVGSKPGLQTPAPGCPWAALHARPCPQPTTILGPRRSQTVAPAALGLREAKPLMLSPSPSEAPIRGTGYLPIRRCLGEGQGGPGWPEPFWPRETKHLD